jgi:hypothetical protein
LEETPCITRIIFHIFSRVEVSSPVVGGRDTPTVAMTDPSAGVRRAAMVDVSVAATYEPPSWFSWMRGPATGINSFKN